MRMIDADKLLNVLEKDLSDSVFKMLRMYIDMQETADVNGVTEYYDGTLYVETEQAVETKRIVHTQTGTCFCKTYYDDVKDLRKTFEDFYTEAEAEYRKANAQDIPVDEDLVYADAYRQCAYDAWQMVCKVYRGKDNG